MEKQNMKAWLYLLPAFLFLGAFMIYPLIDVFVYSFEEGYNSASQTFYGIGMYNYSYVLHDPYFLQALKNTFILVIITVPDHIFPALCDQYSGGRSGLHDSFQKNSLLRRSDQSTDPVFRRQLRGFHRRTLLGENVRAVLLHHLDRYAL